LAGERELASTLGQKNEEGGKVEREVEKFLVRKKGITPDQVRGDPTAPEEAKGRGGLGKTFWPCL